MSEVHKFHLVLKFVINNLARLVQYAYLTYVGKDHHLRSLFEHKERLSVSLYPIHYCSIKSQRVRVCVYVSFVYLESHSTVPLQTWCVCR